MKRIAITVDGEIITDPVDVALALAVIEGGGADVVTLTSPLLNQFRDRRIPWVGYVDDWGATRCAVNRKAWALYGRSPIYGTMVVKTDHNTELPEAFVAMVSRPIDEWVPVDVLARMEDLLTREADA